MNILIVEDNQKLSDNVATVLRHEQYQVEQALDGETGLRKASINKYDLLILDLALPDMDGLEVCRKLREKGKNLPVLMLTARIDLSSKVEGLDAGADDYLAKPFMMDELLARVRALTRRTSKAKQTEFKIGKVTIDLLAKQVTKGGKKISLSPTEMKIIEFLLVNKGKVKNATDVYESVWGSQNTDVLFSDTLKVHIARLRHKLGKDVIETVPGFGYRIN
ncbi:response regulator transcription factor [Patescibacteria group bacterium]